MKISISNSQPFANLQKNKIEYHSINSNSNDSFVHSNIQNNPTTKEIAFKGGFLSRLFGKHEIVDTEQEEKASPYVKSLRDGIYRIFGEKIPLKDFSSIMSAEEFKKELKNYTVENFNKDNFDVSDTNKIYCADLDCASTFSIGKTDIYTLLEKVAKTADIYHAKTGKKFTFALTDRDTIEGVQQAVRIVASEPDKFKNMNFIPAMKMTFTHEVPGTKNYQRFENSEMLIYGINPFSEDLIKSVEEKLKKRKEMTIAFITSVNKLYPQFGYTVKEFAEQNGIKYQKDFGVSNLYWRVREYIETKGDIEIRGINFSSEEIKKETIKILNSMYKVEQGSENRTVSAIGSTIVKDDEKINKSIKSVFREHATYKITHRNNKEEVISEAENTIDEMMNLFNDEETRPVMALCAPYYLSHYFKDTTTESFNAVINFIKDLQKRSQGKINEETQKPQFDEPMLIAFETMVPKYRLDDKLFKRPTVDDFPNDDPATFNPNNPNFFKLKEEPIVKTFNEYIRRSDKINLYEVGGSWHDPYRDKFLI